jgi:hypothetical protein
VSFCSKARAFMVAAVSVGAPGPPHFLIVDVHQTGVLFELLLFVRGSDLLQEMIWPPNFGSEIQNLASPVPL